MKAARIAPGRVRETLEKHLLVDGFPMVVDLERSHGSWFVDARDGEEYLDFYTFFASSPLGFNHPRLLEPGFLAKLGRVAVHKPANSDVMSVELAEFVRTMSRVAIPPELPHLFLVEGGALAVENGMKAAFDWKVRKNLARGVTGRGTQILHFRDAFHGRSGYTLSVTNTDPVKTMHFPKFDWPRIPNPALAFPLTAERLAEVRAKERKALAAIDAAFDERPDDIAAILVEPVQCEGGGHHFRAEFLRELRRIADEREALLVFDEVQTGVGTTGKMWAYEHFGLVPDIVCFAKKMQVGGILCSRRIEEVPDHVFAMSSRINSTWGGGLVDMVRATRILEVIDEEELVGNAADRGRELLAGLESFVTEFPGAVSNPRGLGLLLAFDLPDADTRERVRRACLAGKVLVLKSGMRSIRLRPALNVTAEEAAEGLRRIRGALREVLTAGAAGDRASVAS